MDSVPIMLGFFCSLVIVLYFLALQSFLFRCGVLDKTNFCHLLYARYIILDVTHDHDDCVSL